MHSGPINTTYYTKLARVMHSGPVYTTYYTKLARVLDTFPIPSFEHISGSGPFTYS